MTLQAIGADNTVAALGASWTDAHFEMLKSLFGRHNTTATLCWIPDSDQKAGQLIDLVQKSPSTTARKPWSMASVSP